MTWKDEGTTGPRILEENPDFRVVRNINGDYIFEQPDGCDALGVERWKAIPFTSNDRMRIMLRDWIIRRVTRDAKE